MCGTEPFAVFHLKVYTNPKAASVANQLQCRGRVVFGPKSSEPNFPVPRFRSAASEKKSSQEINKSKRLDSPGL
jgi:hypothetical protein